MMMFDIKRRDMIVPALMALLILTLGFFSGSLEQVLRYDREAIFGGEWWRLMTAHFLHLSWSHLWMNLAGIVLVFAFFGALFTQLEWLFLIIFSALAVSLTLLAVDPGLHWYVGLSGVLHALFLAGGIRNFSVRRTEAIIFLGLIGAKLAWEQIFGPLPGSEETAGGPVLVDAHFFGAIAGLIGVVLLRWTKPRR